MKKLIFAAALITGTVLPGMAIAQKAILPQTVPAGTVVCRPPVAGETPNGAMGTHQLMCRAVDVPKVNTALGIIRSIMAQNSQTQSAKASAASVQASTQRLLQEQMEVNNAMLRPVNPGHNGRAEG